MQIVKLINLRFELSGQPMAIGIISNFNAAMAKLIAHIAYIMAAEKPYRSVGMSQVMDTDNIAIPLFSNNTSGLL